MDSVRGGPKHCFPYCNQWEDRIAASCLCGGRACCTHAATSNNTNNQVPSAPPRTIQAITTGHSLRVFSLPRCGDSPIVVKGSSLLSLVAPASIRNGKCVPCDDHQPISSPSSRPPSSPSYWPFYPALYYNCKKITTGHWIIDYFKMVSSIMLSFVHGPTLLFCPMGQP